MKFTKLKILALFLLFTATVPVLYSLYYNASIYVNRELMKSNLEKRELVSVTISGSEYLADVLFSNEIEINGKMFDIKNYKIAGDKIVVSGMYDVNEDELIANNNNFLGKQRNNDTPLNNITAKFFSQFTLENFQRYDCIGNHNSAIIPVVFSEYNEDLKSAFPSRIFPPPKQVC